MSCRPSRSIAGVRVGGVSLKYRPIDGATAPALPLGCMCSSTTRSVSVLEAPGEFLRQQRRHLARRPAEKMAVGIGRRSRDQPVVAGPGIAFVEAPRRAASCRCGCSRGERPSDCPAGTPGRARSATVSTGIGSTKIWKTSVPSAGSVYGCGSVMTRSGLPSCQPSVQTSRLRGEASADLRIALRIAPAGQPIAQQADLRVASADAGRRTDRRAGSAFHGGMKRSAVTVAICARVPLRVGVGQQAERSPIRPGDGTCAQRSASSGATSFV